MCRPTGKTTIKTVQSSILLVLMAVLTAGCGTSLAVRDNPAPSDTPGWVQSLHDPLQDLPLLDSQRAPSIGITDADVRLGEPQELGFRVQSRQVQSSQPSTPKSGGAQTNLHMNAEGFGFIDPQEEDAEPRAADLPSSLELAYRGDLPERPDRKLEQFGYKLIRTGTSAKTSSALPPADHLIAPGDELIIDLTTDEARPIFSDRGRGRDGRLW